MPEPHHQSLTALAHQRLADVLAPGDIAIDATAGNGHDTLFLAQQIAPGGRVHAFDIQPKALEATHMRLVQAGLAKHVTLHLAGHEKMREHLPGDLTGQVAAVTFNLGYLPGGDHDLVTCPDTTLAALVQASTLLHPGRLLSVLVYRGHAGGREEAEAVADWFAGRTGLDTEVYDSPGPIAYLARRACRSPAKTVKKQETHPFCG